MSSSAAGLGAEGRLGKDMWSETPLIWSPHLSERLNCNVYLKLEVRLSTKSALFFLTVLNPYVQNLQPCQSFKYRGISHFVRLAVESHGPSTHLFVASGGNAGLAVATASKALKARCTVFLPTGANERVLQFFRTEGADVRVQGTCYAEAVEAAKLATESDSNG